MKNILVLCTGNSCRRSGKNIQRRSRSPRSQSVGNSNHGRRGIDISSYTSNHVDEYAKVPFDFVITVCDNAKEQCPYFPTTAQKFHHNFPDPTKASGTDDEIKAAFRHTRDLIKAYCKEFIDQNFSNSAFVIHN